MIEKNRVQTRSGTGLKSVEPGPGLKILLFSGPDPGPGLKILLFPGPGPTKYNFAGL